MGSGAQKTVATCLSLLPAESEIRQEKNCPVCAFNANFKLSSLV
jgi:hypothetical protein